MDNLTFLPLLISEPVYVIHENQVLFTDIETTKQESNQKVIVKILIFSKPLSDKETAFLTKVLSAINIYISDIFIENTPKFPADYDSDRILCFGLTPEKFSFPAYTIGHADNKKVILGDSLSEIEQNIEKKKKLWEVLKQLFIT